MNLNKHLEFFNPLEISDAIHIIGCGAIGSTLAENLTRLGMQKLYLYDFDLVNAHNIANQMFEQSDIGRHKILAVSEQLKRINPAIQITAFEKGYTNQPLAGHVFLCVDDIDLRRRIVADNLYNTHIKSMFDFRMRLSDAQAYAADWTDNKMKEDLLNSMQFTHDEAKESTPVSACGTSLSILPTVRTIVSYGVANWINFMKDEGLKKLILIDTFQFTLDAF